MTPSQHQQLKAPSRLSRRMPLETHAADSASRLPASRRTSAASTTPRFTRQQALKLTTPTRYADRGPDMDQLPELSPAPAPPHKISPLPSPANRGPAPGSRLAALRKARAEAAASSSANSSINGSDDSSDSATASRPSTSRTTRPSLEPPSRLSSARKTRSSIDPPPRLGLSRSTEESASSQPSATPKRTDRPSIGTSSNRTPYRSGSETPKRSTRLSLEPRTPQRRTTPAKAPPALTPSQQRQEAARKRREAADAASEEAKRTAQSSRRRTAVSNRAKIDEAPSLRPSKSYRVKTDEQPQLRSTASFHSQATEQPRLRQSTSYRVQTDEASRLRPSSSLRSRTEQYSLPRAATAYRATADNSTDERSIPSLKNKSNETATPRTAAARARFLDRGYTSTAPVASTNVRPVPRRRLTGGGDTPNRLKRASQMRTQRPSLPGDGVPVSRRLDVSGEVEATSAIPARNKTIRSRAEAMNAIAASTTGSHRLDTSELAVEPAPVSSHPAPLETVVPRTPGKHRGALESFRRTRRASQEAEAARRASLEAEAARRGSIESEEARRASVDPEAVGEEDGIDVVDKREDRCEPGGGLAETWRTSTSRVDGTKLLSVEILSDESSTSDTPALRSGRFSDAGSSTTLGGAARLRESLGRRRSRGTQDLSSIAPPQLRRRSLKLGEHKPLSVGLARLSMGDTGAREPLGRVDHGHGGIGNTNSTQSGSSRLKGFKLGDDRLTWADDVHEELFNA